MTNIRLWIDDERQMPEGFTHWAKTSQEAIDILDSIRQSGDVLALVCFDHDLGYSWEDGHPQLDGGVQDDNSRPVVKWMHSVGLYPELAIVHSQNPIGAAWIVSELKNHTQVIRQPYNPKDYL